ncbi:MAG: hypothetical protein F082_1869 [bacterium F082]|nr:MAG: hypothetical protein F082_1869 [bacterium F082]
MKKNIFKIWLMALPMLLGLAACAEHDNPTDPNPLAKQVSGLWWTLIDTEGTFSDAADSYPYTRMGQAVCFNEDGTGYGVTFFFNDEQGDPIAIIGGEWMAPFTYTSTADGRLSLNFDKAYQEYADYFKKWTMTYASETVTATNGTLTLTLEKPSEQMAVMIHDWDEQFNGGLTPTSFNANTDFTASTWRTEEWIYIYDGVGTDHPTKNGFTIVALPWNTEHSEGTLQTNLPDGFCNDITPENGWELALNLCGSSTGSVKNNNFFALYNKYLGILRFFYFMPADFSSGNDHLWQVSMGDNLAQHSLYGYGVPSDRTFTNKALIGQTGADTYMEYVTPWVDYRSSDGLIVPNAGWWAFDVDLSIYRPNANHDTKSNIKLQMRSWDEHQTSLYSALTAGIEGTIKADLKLDQVVKKKASSNSAKGVLMGLQAVAQAGSAVANFYTGNWAAGLTSVGQMLGTSASLAGLGDGGSQPASYTGSLDGTISLGMNGNMNTDGVISGSKATTGVPSPTISLNDFDLKNSHVGQGVWNLKTAPKVYSMDYVAYDTKYFNGDYYYLNRPFFFDPSSIEVELNPDVFPESQIEWMEVDAICGASADKQINPRSVYNITGNAALRDAYGVVTPGLEPYWPHLVGTTPKLVEDRNTCLWDFLYNMNDKHGMDALYTILNLSNHMSFLKIQGRGKNGFAIEPQVAGANYEEARFWVTYPFLEVNVKVKVKMRGMENPIVLSRNYLPEIKEYGQGAEFAASAKKTRPYASKMQGHTDLYDYQMKRISDIIERYSLPGGKWDSYNYIPMASSDPYEKDNYGYDKLFDGTSTDWYTSIKKDGVWFAEFKSRQPITPSKYYLTTCINTSSYPHYNPKNWKVMAKANQGDSWTTIATVTNDSRLPADNRKRIEYDLSVTGRQWQYFRFEISDNHGGDFMQLAEFEFDKK